MDYVVLSLAWVFWFVLHSVLVAVRCTDFLQQCLQDRFRYYRLVYNLFSILTFVPLLFYSQYIAGDKVFLWDGCMQYLRFVLLLGALIVFYLGARRYDLAQFIGLRQIRCGILGRGLQVGGGIDEGGILGFVRHPWYLAVLILIWARDLAVADFIVNGIVIGYIVVGTRLEERKLAMDIGGVYEDYQRRVSMLVPLKWILQRVKGSTKLTNEKV